MNLKSIKNKLIAVLAVLFCALLVVGTALLIPKNSAVYAGVSPNSALDVDELMLADYKTRADGMVFNGATVQKLYKNLTGNSSATFDNVRTLAASKLNAQQIRSNASGQSAGLSDTIGEFNVEFGGKEWMPTYLSTDSSGNVILTLWLADSTDSFQWNEWAANNTSYQYPSNLYSTSKIRSFLVGSDYVKTAGATTLTSGVQSNTWRDFIANYSDYIVTPSAVEWQEHETARANLLGKSTGGYSNLANGYNFDLPNECWGTPGASNPLNGITGTNWYNTSPINMENVYNATDGSGQRIYGAWSADALWLPSITETGDNSSFLGMWHLSVNQLSVNQNVSVPGTFLRSGWHMNADKAFYIIYKPSAANTTSQHYDASVNYSYYVRPALHLNLTAVASKTTKVLSVPENIEVTYNGDEQSLSALGSDKLSWYDEDLYSEDVVVTYKVNNELCEAEDVIDANIYTVTITAPDGTGKTWADKRDSTPSSITKTIILTIKQKPIELNVDWEATPPTATIRNYDSVIVGRDIERDEEYNTIPIIVIVYTGGRLGGGSETDFSKLLPSTYTATAKIKDGTGANYKLKQTYSETITITTLYITVDDEKIVWQIKNGGDTQEFTENEDGERKVRYNTKAYTLSIIEDNLPENIKVDRYENNVQTNYQSGAYTTTVYLTSEDPDYTPSPSSFTVSWFIGQGLYDLTSVKWDYEEPFVYDLTSHSVTLIIPDELKDEGLSFTFAQSGSVNSATDANTYTAKIILSGSNNYVTPTNGDKSTYIYNGDDEDDDFPWELKWVIDKAPVNFEWVSGLDGIKATGLDNKTFYLPKVIDPDSMVTVKYYRAEDFNGETGEIKNDNPILPSEMFVAESADQVAQGTYFAVLEFTGTYGNNYRFGIGWFKEFNTYDTRSSLVITISETEYTYDGDAHGVYGTEVTITGALQSVIATYVEYEYFSVADDGAESSLGTQAPKDAGTYKIKVWVIAEGESLLVINGESEFEFTIETRVLEAPTDADELTYDGKARDIATLFNLPEGWENYLEATITAKIDGAIIPDVNELKIAADYTVNFRIKTGINSGDKNNVEWNVDSGKTSSKDAKVKIKVLTLNAVEWEDDGYDSRVIFDESNGKNFVVYTVKNEAGEVVDRSALSAGVTYFVEVTIGEEHEGNVEIIFAEDITYRHEFFIDGGVPATKVKTPTIAPLTFNGKSQTFDIDYGEFKDYIEIDSTQGDLLTQRDAGDYTVFFKIKNGQNAVWEDTGARGAIEVKFKMNPLVLQDPEVKQGEKFTYTGSEQSPTLNIDAQVLAFLNISSDFVATDAGDYTFTLSILEIYAGNVVWASSLDGQESEDVKEVSWTIDKAKLPVKWTGGKVPELDLPKEFNGIEVEYTFTDEEGNEVGRDELEHGKKYTVTAKLKDGSALNFEFIDDGGATLETPTTTDWGFEFNNPPQKPFDMWWIFVVVGFVLVSIVLVVAIVVAKKRKAAAAAEANNDYYNDNYYGDDNGYDDYDDDDDDDDEVEEIIIIEEDD